MLKKSDFASGSQPKSKYDNYYFWENIIKNNRFHNQFFDDLITQQTVFIYGVIINCHGVGYEKWLQFPNTKALLGFLNHVFMPAVFFTFLTEIDDVRVPQICLDDILGYFSKSDDCREKPLIPYMKYFLLRLREIWSSDAEKCIMELKNVSKIYNALWSKESDKFSYFEVFRTPMEVGQYLFDSFEKWEGVDISMLEELLGVSREGWLSICGEAYENDFMKRKFIEVLNNRLIELPGSAG